MAVGIVCTFLQDPSNILTLVSSDVADCAAYFPFVFFLSRSLFVSGRVWGLCRGVGVEGCTNSRVHKTHTEEVMVANYLPTCGQ